MIAAKCSPNFRLYKHVSRAKEKDETAGLVKILADAEQFLGAAILGVSRMFWQNVLYRANSSGT